jgi:hypothetical protein
VTRPGDATARAWTAIYTRGLPEEVAARRRDEIASDLFEHADELGPSTGQQLAVVGRVLWGIPADLSWRRDSRASLRRRVSSGEPMKLNRVMQVLAMVVCAFCAYAGFMMIGLGDAGLPFTLPLLAGAVLIVIGLLQRTKAPRRSTVLLVIGTAAPVATFYWMAALFLPFWILISVLIVISEPGRRSPQVAA